MENTWHFLQKKVIFFYTNLSNIYNDAEDKMNSKLSEYTPSEEQSRDQQSNGSVSFYNDHFAHLKGFTFEIVTKDIYELERSSH